MCDFFTLMEWIPAAITGIFGCIQWVYKETEFIWCACRNKRTLEKAVEELRSKKTSLLGPTPTTEEVGETSSLHNVNNKENEVKELLDYLGQGSRCTCCFVAYKGKKISNLTKDVNTLVELGKKMKELKGMQEDIKRIIHKQELEKPGTECRDVVKRWLGKVDGKYKEVNAILQPVAESSNWVENVNDLTVSIQSLVEEGKAFEDTNLVEDIPNDPIHNIPDLVAPMVGRDSKLSEIHGYIKDSQVKTIGIWGAGGIGKTTLLKSIKDELSKNRDLFFHIVSIKIKSHKDVDILDIQQQIAECISHSFDSEVESNRKRKLLKVLRDKKKNSLILIDNVWNKLDFERIGIPFGVNIYNVKIVFTTRSNRVCTDMNSDVRTRKIVKLDYLDEEESRKLFKEINPTVDQTARQRVDEILQKCGGLPLAILTVARTVATYTRVEEWDVAVKSLRNSPAEIEDMDDVMKEILTSLEVSYDNLQDDEIRSCLLYFSLYPEGTEILNDKLIKEWVGGEFLNLRGDRCYNKGYVIMSILKSICLVESGTNDDHVKVHGVIREMLCWISKKERKDVFLVYHKDNDQKKERKEDWDLVKGIYLNELKPPPGVSLCPNLTTLIVKPDNHDNQIIETPNYMSSCPNLMTLIVEANPSLPTEDFFHFTPSLRVLDLSRTGLVELPKSIGELGELRYLNLFRTFIKMLPVEVGNLKKLTCLDLGETSELQTIPKVAISQLSMLQSLNLFNTEYQWNSAISVPPLLMFEDLRELKNLEDLGVDVSSNSHINTILGNQILLNSITRIRFKKIDFVKEHLQPIKVISERFPQLKRLIVDGCVLPDNVLEIKADHRLVVKHLYLWNLEISSVVIVKHCPFHSLEYLQISMCRCLKQVSWTTQLPSLKEFIVENCNGVEELVATEEEIEEERECYFPKLIGLFINDMENLQSIYGWNRPLFFPALKKLSIQNCPKLKGLSLGLDSAKEIEIIRCEQHQWDSLEWEDDQVRARFLPYLRAS